MADKPKEYDIEEAFRLIEEDLINSLKRRLEHGIIEDDGEKAYQVWQAEQLQALQQYRYTEDKKFKKRFIKLNEKIKEMIKDTSNTYKLLEVSTILKRITGIIKAHDPEDEISLLNKNKLNALIEATTHDMERAEYATLRMMDDQYRRIIYNAQVYLNTGSGTLRGAIDMAARDFIAAGINSIEYKNGARVNIASYSEMALRTANKRAALQGAAAARDEYDLSLVIISRSGAMCPKCAQFGGRVCIDNVFGAGKPDGKHPLLSDFIAGGLYHPNCRDTHTTYFEGISEPPKPISKEQQAEIQRVYELEQRQRYNERQIRKWKRLEQNSLDPENVKKAAAKRKEWQARQRAFINEHEELRRKYDREKVY